MANSYVPGEGCKCAAYSEHECCRGADWTPVGVYRLHAELAIAEEDLAAVGKALEGVEYVGSYAEGINKLRNQVIEECAAVAEAELDDPFLYGHGYATCTVAAILALKKST